MLSGSSVFAAILCTAACAAPCFAQIYPNYNIVGSPQTPNFYTGNAYAVDLNNDGVPDLIENNLFANSTSLPDFAVFIANGDGTFKSPVLYQYPAGPSL